MELAAVVCQYLLRLLMLGLHQVHYLLVNLGGGLRRTGEGGVAPQVLVLHGLQGHHVKVAAHAVAGDHGPGQFRGLLNIVAGARGDRAEHHFLGGPAPCQGGNFIFQLLLGQQVFLPGVHLHGVTQSSAGAGDDGNFLHGGGMGLLCRHQGVADLVVRDNELLPVREDGVLLLVPGNHRFNALFQVGLRHHSAVLPHCPQGGLIDDVRQFRARGTRSHAGNGVEVHIRGHPDLFGVHLQNSLPALQVWQLHRHPAVKPPGAGQGRVQALRPVGGRQNDDPCVFLKAIHLCKQLVQCLLPLVVPAYAACVSLLADGVDLVDKHNAGGLFLCLLKKVPHLRGAHAHKHLHKLTARHGEEGHACLSGHRLGQHGLAGAGRAHQQDPLGHGGPSLGVLFGVVKIVHNFLQAFFGLVLAGHIRKLDALGGLDIHLGVGFSKAHRVGAASPLHQFFIHIIAQQGEQDYGQHPADEEAEHGVCPLQDLPRVLGSGILK